MAMPMPPVPKSLPLIPKVSNIGIAGKSEINIDVFAWSQYSTEPWGTPLVTSHQLNVTPFTTTLGPSIQPVFNPAKNGPVKGMSCQFLRENAMGDSVEVLIKSRLPLKALHNLHCPPLENSLTALYLSYIVTSKTGQNIQGEQHAENVDTTKEKSNVLVSKIYSDNAEGDSKDATNKPLCEKRGPGHF
ncbi:hypothetical protein HGM15179_007902 [Zosterops borbonicus]|uniref:Uncharacterized protein n=1 Tax=Zosterops borbonicus TaxID=364589 RepID=A0A8K1GHY1_9PASS|nr:hypothetical protein HGM15179_007902 [Zosterops borbonicus]